MWRPFTALLVLERVIYVLRLFHKQFVGEAPHPVFAGLDGLNERVLRPMVVLGRVLVLGRVATPRVAAAEAGAEMNPRIAHRDAFATDVRRRRNAHNRVHVRTILHNGK